MAEQQQQQAEKWLLGPLVARGQKPSEVAQKLK